MKISEVLKVVFENTQCKQKFHGFKMCKTHNILNAMDIPQ